MKRSSPFPPGLWWHREWCKATISGLDFFSPRESQVLKYRWLCAHYIHRATQEENSIASLQYNHQPLLGITVRDSNVDGLRLHFLMWKTKGEGRRGEGGSLYDQQTPWKVRSLVLFLTQIHQTKDFAISRKYTLHSCRCDLLQRFVSLTETKRPNKTTSSEKTVAFRLFMRIVDHKSRNRTSTFPLKFSFSISTAKRESLATSVLNF